VERREHAINGPGEIDRRRAGGLERVRGAIEDRLARDRVRGPHGAGLQRETERR